MGLFDDIGTAQGVEIAPSGVPRITITPKQTQENPYASAISSIESGGNYRAVGPQTGKGRAVGRYQVMDFNIGPWTEEVLGQRMTPMQFLANPKAQDAVFNAKFGGYVDKYGPEGASRAWFAGEGGMNDPNRRDVLGTSVSDYSRKFTSAMGPQTNDMAARSKPGLFDDIPAANPVEERFPAEQPDNPELRTALTQRAAEMTRGPELAPSQRMAVDFENVVGAASQGTNPNVDRYSGRLVSDQAFQGDDGQIYYKDPASGQVVPTNSATQVAIRDPADGVVKVFSRAEDTNEGAAVGVARVLSPGLAAGAPMARPSIPMPSAAQIAPKASDIFATAKPYYRAFKNEAGKIEVPADTASGIANQLRGALERVNLTEEMAGAPARSALSMLESGKVTSLADLQKVKRMAGRGFNSAEKDVRDGASALSGEISKVIAQVSKEAGSNLKTGDTIHSTARAVQDLQRKADVADLRAGSGGYGGNAVNSMRQVLKPIVQKSVEGKMTGFKPDEIQAMREIVEGTTLTNALRGVGQLSPSKGIIQTVGAGGAMYAAGPVALAIPALGAASNKLATLLTGQQIGRLQTLVAKRSPAYAQAVAKATRRYEQSQAAFISNPSPNKFAGYLSASRALSAGLTRDGIPVSSGDLLRAIQAPAKSAAESEEPPVPRGPGQ